MKIQNCSGCIELPYSDEIIDQIIKAAYEGADNMVINIQFMEDLISFGLDNNVKQILAKCAAYLLSNVCVENVCDFIKLSKPLPKENLPIKQKLYQYAARNVKYIGNALMHLALEDLLLIFGDCNLNMSKDDAENIIKLWINMNNTTMFKQ